MPDTRVLIVGGGIAGLTLAGLLHRRGFTNLLIVEKAKEYGDKGYVLGLWGNALRIARGLEIYQQMLDIGSSIDDFLIIGDDGTVLRKFDLTEMKDKFGPAVIIRRAELLGLLYSSVKDRVPVRFSESITAISQDRDGVDVTFTSGDCDRFDLVVGADGIKSVVRNLTMGPQPFTFWGVRGCGFWVKHPPSVPKNAVTEIWGPQGKMIGMYPHGDSGLIATCCTTPSDKPGMSDTHEERLERIKREFKGWGGVVPEILESLDSCVDLLSDDLLELELDRPMFEGRVVLIGDSAHAVLPTVGTGATLAMESAAVLAEELCLADSSWRDIELALQHYQQRRGPRIFHVRREANSLADVISWQNPLAVLFRTWAMSRYPQNAFSSKLIEMVFEPI